MFSIMVVMVVGAKFEKKIILIEVSENRKNSIINDFFFDTKFLSDRIQNSILRISNFFLEKTRFPRNCRNAIENRV